MIFSIMMCFLYPYIHIVFMTDTGITGITGITGTSTGVGSVDTSSGSGFLSGTYKGTVGIGQFRASLTLIIAIILAIIMVLCGTYLVFNNDDELYLTVNGKVMKADCVSNTTRDSKGNTTNAYKCNITVGYEIDNNKYAKQIFVRSSEDYLQGEPISLWVKKSDLTDVRQAGFSGNLIGSGLMCGSLIIVSIAYLQYYLTYRYEVFASAQGIGTVVDIIA
jgi:hypothetical protein